MEREKAMPYVKVCPDAEELQWKPSAKGTRFLCPLKNCKAFAFKSQGGLTQHINTVHPQLSRWTGSDKDQDQVLHFHCPQTGCYYHSVFDRWFSSFQQLKYHYTNTHGEKRFPCRKCDKCFGWERDRERHERECGQMFVCGTCSAKYPSRCALLTHCKRKQHPVPREFEKPQKKKSSESINTVPQNTSTAGGDSKANAASKGRRGSPRPILPKGVMILAPKLTAFNSSHDGGKDGPKLICTSSAYIQTDAVDTGPFTQRLNASGVSTGCQVGSPRAISSGRQVDVANMATQVSVDAHRNSACLSEICHMGTQVSGPALTTVDTSQITDMAIQASVDLVNSGTQMVGDFHVGDGFCGGNSATQSSAVLVHSGTQMDLNPQVSAVAVQTGCRSDVANMAIQATNQIVDFAHMATQATGDGDGVFDMSVQASFTESDFEPLMMNPELAQSSSSLSGTNIGTQASFPFITVNKRSSTNTVGTQKAVLILQEESETASTGMQTSLTLIPSRPRFGVIAQTQTSGDHILRSAMASANIPITKSPARKSKGVGRSPAKKRGTKSSEAQTQDLSSRRKKRRVKGKTLMDRTVPGVVEDFSIATQTLPPLADRLGGGKANTPAHLRRSMVNSVQVQQNPILSSSAVGEDENEMLVPFLSAPSPPRVSTSDTGLQADLDDFLSTYTSEFGVQTQDDFLSACTAELGVQTHDPCQETSTVDLGVQTVMTSLGSLLDDLDHGGAHAAGIENSTTTEAGDIQMRQSSFSSAGSEYQSVVDCGTGTEVLTLDSQTQTRENATSAIDNIVAQLTEVDGSLSAVHQQTNSKLFDSFDSDLSFSDCGTGTEDFFASTHTQTNADYTEGGSGISSTMPTLECGTGTEDYLAHTHTQTHATVHGGVTSAGDDSIMDLFLSDISQNSDSNQRTLSNKDLTLSNFEAYQLQGDNTCEMTSSKSSSTTDPELPSVPAADMHTQTADDLLDFLMNNMETQTTEDIPDSTLAVADTQTQTTGSSLMTPPHAVSPSPGLNLSPFDRDTLSLVTAETQTSSQCTVELDEEGDEFFDIADMQTQTTFDLLVD